MPRLLRSAHVGGASGLRRVARLRGRLRGAFVRTVSHLDWWTGDLEEPTDGPLLGKSRCKTNITPISPTAKISTAADRPASGSRPNSERRLRFPAISIAHSCR